MTTMDYIFRMFENNKEVSFDMFSGQELSSITETLSTMLQIDDEQIIFCGEEDEKIKIKNVENMKKKLNEKIPIVLKQYGVNAWGKVEFMFEPIDL